MMYQEEAEEEPLSGNITAKPSPKDEELLRRSLPRLYNEVSLLMNQGADKHFGACDALANRFNELLRSARIVFPSDSEISELKELQPTNHTMIDPLDIPQVEKLLQETKVRTLQLMDILDIEVKEKTPARTKSYRSVKCLTAINSQTSTSIN